MRLQQSSLLPHVGGFQPDGLLGMTRHPQGGRAVQAHFAQISASVSFPPIADIELRSNFLSYSHFSVG